MNIEKNGQDLRLRGINLGSWLNIEDFMIGLEGTDWEIRAAFRRHLGDTVANQFFENYTGFFITAEDLREIARLGFNTVRLPFNYRHFESDAAPGTYDETTFARLDAFFDDCAECRLWVVLDFHACPGGQNTTQPADNPTGYARLWQSADDQDRVSKLWCALARRYAHHPAFLGYDLMNEPQTDRHGELSEDEQVRALNAFSRRLIEDIRRIDKEGWIIVEGPVRQSGGIAKIDTAVFEDPRTVVSYHHYPLFEHGIGRPGSHLPDTNDPGRLQSAVREQIAVEIEYARNVQRPLLLGECGFGSRFEPTRTLDVLQAQVAVAEEQGVHWLLWSYKDLHRMGLYTPRPDTAWVRFTRDPEWLNLLAEINQTRHTFFDQTYGGRLPRNPANARVWDGGFDDMKRGQNRILLDYQVSRLAELPSEEVARMPEAFALRNCRLREDAYAILQPYL